jgi:alpha-L-fucosidase
LHELADWVAIHGEAIYGSRPWLVYGEGAVRTKGGHFHEDFKYTAKDIRFTTKGNTLYAIALGWPEDGKLLVKSLASTGEGQIKKVSLLGSKEKVSWSRTPQGLMVSLPGQKLSPYTCALRINGAGLKPAPAVEETSVVEPDANGELVLPADSAEIHGDKLNTEERDGQMNLAFWDNAGEWASWRVRVQKPGNYHVSASVATINDGAQLLIEAGANQVTTGLPASGDWGAFKVIDLGQLELPNAGEQVINIRPKDAASWKAINLRFVKLTPKP